MPATTTIGNHMDDHSLECLDFLRIRELLAEYALTGLARGLAAGIRPVSRAALVRRWLDQVRELQRLQEERGTLPFGGIRDVREMLPKCAPPIQVTVEEMAQIGDTLAGTHALSAYLRDLPDSYPEFRHLADRVGDFRTIADRIHAVIDERAQVRDDASPKLQRIRGAIEEARHDIQRVVERLLSDPGVRRLLQYPNHTFHGDRLVLPLRSEYHGRLPGIIHRSSDSGATMYVEPAEVVELNNRISSLRSEELEEIGRLLWDLSHEIHLNHQEIRRTLDTLAVIDLVAAKVRFAKDFELRCPQINEDGRLNVRAARHPLLVDLARRAAAAGGPPRTVVPIDYRLGEDFQQLVITGPNTGGKTVTLKTIGLVSLMIQAGVPAPVGEGSEVGIFSHVLIDVGDEQSMQQSLSTFSGHMTRILDMLRKAGPRTLILIDELGAGTDPDEGAALGRAVLDELLRLHCPSIVTTHLGALKGHALTRSGAENACVEFDARTLQPTYHLCIGEPGQSNAIEIAQRLGMSRRMVNAARRNLSRKARALHSALAGTRTAKREAEDARRAAEQARLHAGHAASQAEAARVDYERKRADFEQWLLRVVHLQPGDPVRVRNFDRDGKIVRLRLEQQRAEVDVGVFSVEVPLADVLPPETTPPPARPLPTVVAAGSAPRPPKPRKAAPPATARASAPAPRAAAPPPRREPARAPDPPRDAPALSDEEFAALKPLDSVYVKRFHREGRIARLKLDKGVAIVSLGQLEVEVPRDGLAQPRSIRDRHERGEGRQRRGPRRERRPAANAPEERNAAASAPPRDDSAAKSPRNSDEPGAPPKAELAVAVPNPAAFAAAPNPGEPAAAPRVADPPAAPHATPTPPAQGDGPVNADEHDVATRLEAPGSAGEPPAAQ